MALRRFSDNPAASLPLTGAEILPGLQSGSDVQMTTQDIADLATAGAGDVVGPASSVDMTLPRYDGTTGKLLQGSGVTLTDSDELSGYKGNVRFETGTTYTLDVAGT